MVLVTKETPAITELPVSRNTIACTTKITHKHRMVQYFVNKLPFAECSKAATALDRLCPWQPVYRNISIVIVVAVGGIPRLTKATHTIT